MFLAGTLHRLITAGHPVYSIITTDGSGSVARLILNGTDRKGRPALSVFKKRILNPYKEGYIPLNKQNFSTARNHEYFESMQAIGVPEDHIWFANPGGLTATANPVFIDGSLTKELATEVIQSVYDQIGDGIYLAVASDKDETTYQNRDHLAIEQALKEFNRISERYYFGDKEYPSQTIVLSKDEQKAKQSALKAYATWDPKKGRFAVGEHSVPEMLRRWRTDTLEYEIPDVHNIYTSIN
jgi:LmbE family N-acetylglucosaminyl deacetylase